MGLDLSWAGAQLFPRHGESIDLRLVIYKSLTAVELRSDLSPRFSPLIAALLLADLGVEPAGKDACLGCRILTQLSLAD